MKYNLKYTTKSQMTTRNKKFIRTVEYFNKDDEKIGSLITTYNTETKNTTEVFDANGVKIEADVGDAIEGRQFLVDRYEYALQQQSKGAAKKVMPEQSVELMDALKRILAVDLNQLVADIKLLVAFNEG